MQGRLLFATALGLALTFGRAGATEATHAASTHAASTHAALAAATPAGAQHAATSPQPNIGTEAATPGVIAGTGTAATGQSGQPAADMQGMMPRPASPVSGLAVMQEFGSGPSQAATGSIGGAKPDATLASMPQPVSPPAPAADVPAAPPAAPVAPTVSVPLPDYVPATPVISTLPPAALAGAAIAPADITAALAAQGARHALPPKELAEITAFYDARADAPLWQGGEGWSAAARQAITRLKDAAADGLRPADYAVSLPAGTTPAALAEADVDLSVAVVRYARDARGARVDPARISANITARRTLPETASVLETVSAAADADETLQAYNPQQSGYRALRDKLAAIEASAPATPVVRIPRGRILKVGMRDSRVPLLRQRLGLPESADDTYDAGLAAAVQAFQKENSLLANGHLTPRTTMALSQDDRVTTSRNDIIANMERWRWLPREIGESYVMVNIPEYTLRLIEDGKVVHKARVIVGKPNTQTPVFSGEMQYLVVNPYWNVPPSIMKKEFLPHMAEDPDYPARHGYEVVRRGNHIAIRQPPGARNALGRIKFMFPNDHAVYIHDTPSRNLFATARRAYSHGCVRVQDPFELATLVLQAQKGWSEKRLQGMIGHGERYVNLARRLPVHLVYFTTWVGQDGEIESRPDLYGHNRKVEAALGLL